jgi:hypothetical protein
MLWLVIMTIKTSYDSHIYHDAIFKYRKIQRDLKDAEDAYKNKREECYVLMKRQWNTKQQLDIAINALKNIDNDEARATLKDIESWKGDM